MKSFVVCVTVGEFSGQGEGKSKKIAKKLAAAAALAELRQLPHIPSMEKTLPRIKKKTKSIIKVTADTAERARTSTTLPPCPAKRLTNFLVMESKLKIRNMVRCLGNGYISWDNQGQLHTKTH